MGSISLDEKTSSAFCNCCGNKEENSKIWELCFTLGNQIRFVKLCENHLTELKKEINVTI